MMHIASQLQTARGGRMSYQEIADRAGISKNTVERVMNGRHPNPTVATVDKIARAINTKITLGGER